MMLTIKMPTSLIKFKVRQHLSWSQVDDQRISRLYTLRDMLELHTEETISVDEELFKFLDI
jgi:hypothetical protein